MSFLDGTDSAMLHQTHWVSAAQFKPTQLPLPPDGLVISSILFDPIF